MHPFYGTSIFRQQEQEYIRQILAKYRSFPADEELKKRIWEELQAEKAAGRIHIPFKVRLQVDPTHQFPNVVEVLLDTKV